MLEKLRAGVIALDIDDPVISEDAIDSEDERLEEDSEDIEGFVPDISGERLMPNIKGLQQMETCWRGKVTTSERQASARTLLF